MSPAEPFDGQRNASKFSTSPEERFLSRGEAARYVGVPISTIYQWARSGRLHCVVTFGGHQRFSRADLDAVRLSSPPRPVGNIRLNLPPVPPEPGSGHDTGPLA